MRPRAIELWAITVLERVSAGHTFEDARVEMKRAWPEPQKAARRIAAHANTARGEPILWLIGVDQQAGTISNAPPIEMSEWWNAVKSHFNEVFPSMVDVAVAFDEVVVMALVFETDRAPFLVKNPDGGTVQFELPWRDGTSTRTARRSEVLRLLAPLQLAPTIELVDAELVAYWDEYDGAKPAECEWYLTGHVYVTITVERVVMPFHKCSAQVTFAGAAGKVIKFSPVAIGRHALGMPTEGRPSLVTSTGAEAVFDGHSMASFHSRGTFQPDPPNENAHVELVLSPAGIERPVVLCFALARQPEERPAKPPVASPPPHGVVRVKTKDRVVVKWTRET